MKATIFITLKNGILDPQGRAVQQSLEVLGFDSVRDVRIGKLMEINLEDSDTQAAEQTIEAMCQKLLANPVIEDFRYEITGT